MGLGETQVFQDEKSRLANTTVARIVAAKGSLNDPETRETHRVVMLSIKAPLTKGRGGLLRATRQAVAKAVTIGDLGLVQDLYDVFGRESGKR